VAFCVDFQLSHDIDVQQLRYFEAINQKEVQKGDKISLRSRTLLGKSH
jgi:hypothetical protein